MLHSETYHNKKQNKYSLDNHTVYNQGDKGESLLGINSTHKLQQLVCSKRLKRGKKVQ